MHRLLLGACVASLVTCMPASGKCPLIYVELEGELVGAPLGDEDRIVVEVEPEPNAAAGAVNIEEKRFRVELPFDTMKSGGRFHHDCSRRPTRVEIVLISKEEAIARVVLSIKEHFEADDEGDYRVLERVRLERPAHRP